MHAAADFATGIQDDVQALPYMLQALRENSPPAGGVLSAYLPTPPVQVLGQKYLVRFRDECKSIRQQLEEASKDENDAFEVAYTRIEDYLTEMSVPSYPGLALFAAAEDGYLHACRCLSDRPAWSSGIASRCYRRWRKCWMSTSGLGWSWPTGARHASSRSSSARSSIRTGSPATIQGGQRSQASLETTPDAIRR